MIRLGKDRLDVLDNNNVVYKINYKDCSASFISLTMRKCWLRQNEHRRDVINNKTYTFALALHSHNTRHKIDFDFFSIIDREMVKHKREF